MRKFACVALLFLGLNTLMFLHGQWAATYGGSGEDVASSIQPTSDGGYIVAGTTYSFGAGRADAWVLKLSLRGDIEWQFTYGDSDDDGASSVQETGDGGFIVAGHTRSFGAGGKDVWILKLSPDGQVEWQKTYGGTWDEEANSILETSDGGYIVVGATSSFTMGMRDIWVLKLSPDGQVEWQSSFGTQVDDVGWSVDEVSAGGYIVAATTDAFGIGASKFWVLKLSASGESEWQRIYGGTGDDEAASILAASDGGYLVAGSTTSFGAGQADFWLLKLDSAGAIEWERTYGGGDNDYLGSVRQTADDGYVVTGSSASFGTRRTDAWVLKLDSSGVVEWQKVYGGLYNDFSSSIQQTDDGGYIVSGFSQSFGAGEVDFFILKISAGGEIDPLCNLPASSNATVLNTFATFSMFDIVAAGTSVAPVATNILPRASSAVVNRLCEARPAISGYVRTETGGGVGGVTVTFSEGEGTATTDQAGYYSRNVSYGWSGTATPSKTGYAFTPPSRSYTTVTSDQTGQNYTAFEACLISGMVQDDGGQGMADVTITFSNDGGVATTDSGGTYSHMVRKGWSGTATPSRTCYAFTPPSRSYTNVTEDQTGQNYTGILLTYKISGTVFEVSTLAPLSGVAMGGFPAIVGTDASGYYEATVGCGWSGTVTPAKERYIFSPVRRSYSNVMSDRANQNYTAYPAWIVSGTVRTEDGEGIAGGTISFSDNGWTATTGADGTYSRLVLAGWSGTATPSRPGYTFSPPSRNYTDVTSDWTGQDYTGVRIPYTLTISAETGGTTEPPPGSYTNYYGDQVTITPRPESKYKFSRWTGDVAEGKEFDNPLLVTVTSDLAVTAVFERERLCFLASAAYGEEHPFVEVLRRFRDGYLMSNGPGRSMVDFYYTISPLAADFIAGRRVLRFAARVHLFPLVAFSFVALRLGPLAAAVLFLLIAWAPVSLVRIYRKKRQPFQIKKSS